MVDGDVQAATTRLARHLAGTAMRVLASSAPDYTPAAVPRAVALVSGVRSAQFDQRNPAVTPPSMEQAHLRRDQWSREGRSTGPHWLTVARSTCQVFGYIGYSSCHGRGSQ